MDTSSLIIPAELIEKCIFLLPDIRVMLSSDLAELYGISVKVLNQAVKRNSERFPDDFMFQLTTEEFEILKSQFVTSSWGGARTRRLKCFANTHQLSATASHPS